jgi:hypothetical protein
MHDDLFATCAVIRNGDRELALVSLDLLCLAHDIIDKIKTSIRERINVAPENIILACTHTHSGPSTLGLAGKNEQNQRYLSGIPQRVVALIRDARADMTSVKVSVLQTDVPDVAFNRRILLKDGSSAINIDQVNPKEIQALGVTDPVVTAIFFENNSSVKGVIVNFSLHPTTLGETNFQYSRDYPGYLVDSLSDNLSGNPLVLFFNGAFGNINQIKTPGNWISTFEEAQRLGGAIAGYLLEVFSKRSELEDTCLRIAHRVVSIPRRKIEPSGNSDFKRSTRLKRDSSEHPNDIPHHTP